jgi:hypothetical protein
MDISNNANSVRENSSSSSSSSSVKTVYDEKINFDVHSLPAQDLYDSDENERNINKDNFSTINITKQLKNNLYNIENLKQNNENELKNNKVQTLKKVTYRDVERAVSEFYTKQQFYSSAFDIISTYIKGQKILYTEACELNTLYLNLLMLPAIFFSALAGLLSLTFQDYYWGAIVVASINAFNSFLLSVVSYSKLDAASEAHRITSHQYDKLQSICEFTSGCLLVLPYDIGQDKGIDSSMLAKEKLQYIEGKIKDIKETNNFIIPNSIRNDFRNIYYTNVFSLVKKINETESKIIIDMKNLINKCKEIEHQTQFDNISPQDYKEYKTMNSLINQYHKDFIDVQSAYSQIDKMFKLEVINANKKKKNRVLKKICCFNIRSKDEVNFDITESLILDKLKNIKFNSKKKFYKPDHDVNMNSTFN